MKMSFGKWTKIFLLTFCFVLSVLGFMIKLPSVFRHYDKELHAAFYFVAAAFLNLLFANKNIIRHIVIFGCLLLFGICIEHAQAYSNKLFHVKFHGRYDPEDVKSNLKGLAGFSILWFVVVLVLFMYNKLVVTKTVENNT
jgi:hypothetical protein